MGQSVRKLDPLTASQIAAGEVVERPASVVKELVENSIDAKANRIVVEIVGGGLKSIRVSDDGTGMNEQDALSSVERFATSKLRSLTDLERIKSLGFRGEALPSIASCSNLTLETQSRHTASGICLKVRGGTVKSCGEKGLPPGTTITVENLFFNTPARLKFMKSTGRERNAIVETVERLALAWPCISFTLKSDGRVVFLTQGDGLKNAVANIYGPETAESMVSVSYMAHGLTVQGLAGVPRIYRRSRDRQLFSVNNRPVKNSMLGWALDSAYLGILAPKTYPFAVLEITVESEQIDVNVHPTKAEIQFRNEQEVRVAITESVKQALAQKGYLVENNKQEAGKLTQIKKPGLSGFTSPSFTQNREAVPWQIREPSERVEPKLSPELPEGWAYLGSLQDTYLLAKTDDSLLIIDQHSLAESLAYLSLLDGKSGSQELLIPEIITLGPKEVLVYEEQSEVLEKVGFSTRQLGSKTISVIGVPLILGEPLSPNSIKQVLTSFEDEADIGISPERALASARLATAACHSSIKGNQRLTQAEAIKLIGDLVENPRARTCPHGRPTVHRLPVNEIATIFGR